jgi:hypothetical protein
MPCKSFLRNGLSLEPVGRQGLCRAKKQTKMFRGEGKGATKVSYDWSNLSMSNKSYKQGNATPKSSAFYRG